MSKTDNFHGGTRTDGADWNLPSEHVLPCGSAVEVVELNSEVGRGLNQTSDHPAKYSKDHNYD